MKTKRMTFAAFLFAACLAAAGCALPSGNETKADETETETIAPAVLNAVTAAEKETEENTGGQTPGEWDDHIPDGVSDGDRHGTFTVEELGISVPTYWTSVDGDGENAQAIVDAEDSAAYFEYGLQHVVADHNSQGFSALYDAAEGMIARIETEDGNSQEYSCIYVGEGTKDGNLYMQDGKDAAFLNMGGLCTYTCFPDSDSLVKIVFWTPVRTNN